MYEQIQKLIKGSPDQDQNDELWQEFVEQPDNFDLLRTEVMLHQYMNQAEMPNTNPAKTSVIEMTFRIMAIAATILIVSVSSLWLLTQQENKERLLRLNPYDIQGFEMMRSNSTNEYTSLELQINEATTLMLSEQPYEAIRLYDALIDNNEFNEAAWMLHFNRALIYYQLGSYNQALEDLDLVEKENHSSDVILASTWYRLRIALQEGKSNDAKMLAESIIQLKQAFTKDEIDLLKLAGK